MLHIHFYELKQRDSLHTKLHALLLHMSPVAVMHITYFFLEYIKIKTTKWMLYVHCTYNNNNSFYFLLCDENVQFVFQP